MPSSSSSFSSSSSSSSSSTTTAATATTTTPAERRAHKQQYRASGLAAIMRSREAERAQASSALESSHSGPVLESDRGWRAIVGLPKGEEEEEEGKQVIHSPRKWPLNLLLQPVGLSGDASASDARRMGGRGEALSPLRRGIAEQEEDAGSLCWVLMSPPPLESSSSTTRTGSGMSAGSSVNQDKSTDDGIESPSFTPVSPPSGSWILTAKTKSGIPAGSVADQDRLLDQGARSPSYEPTSPPSPPPPYDAEASGFDSMRIKQEEERPKVEETEAFWLRGTWPDQ